ncbi:MAG: sulfatase-like hydrolase/transferase [Candidatus Wallbacteria bacterium]|nr:sulfatase-like hydrolase/transferase [Candidatus Wallbacteria bacterium]
MNLSEFQSLLLTAFSCLTLGTFLSCRFFSGATPAGNRKILFLFGSFVFMLNRIGLTLSLTTSTSLVLFAASLYTFKSSQHPASEKSLFGLLSLSAVILYLAFSLANFFTGKGIDASVIYHLHFGIAGAGFNEFLPLILLTSVFLVCVPLLLFRNSLPESISPATNLPVFHRFLPLVLTFLALFFNPAVSDLWHLRNPQTDTRAFYHYYHTPHMERVSQPMNLVYIYAESLERTWFDETLFPGLINGLRDLERKSTSFTNIRQAEGAGWTMAGMIASQCGLPYFFSSNLAPGLGRLLHENGYYLAFYSGDDSDFAGKSDFYRSQCFDRILGRQELRPLMENPSHQYSWGLYDETLLELAYTGFERLSEEHPSFAQFIATMDTHGSGNPGDKSLSYSDGSCSNLNALASADILISRFVNRIRSSPYSNKTVIVVASDHLAQPFLNPSVKLLKQRERRNLFLINEPASLQGRTVERPGTTLDIGPTLLPFIGFAGRIGLGRNLLARDYSTEETEFIYRNITLLRPDLDFFRF